MAWIIFPISALAKIRLAWAFSTFKILPLRGKIAWISRSRPFLAEPPAELPSTIYNSHLDGSFEEQSASLPGRVVSSSPPFLMLSRALRAASLALAAITIFSIMTLAVFGFSIKNLFNWSPTILERIFLTSKLPNLVLVCPSNWGFGCLTETIAVKPSQISS